MKTLITSLRMLLILTLLTGVLYPALITVLGQTFWPKKAFGSLIQKGDKIIGSQLLAQKFTQAKYFTSRPSMSNYDTIPSGASNLSATSRVFADLIRKRRDAIGANAPAELLTTSGSGLDPHLSPESIRYQLNQVAEARGLSVEQKTKLDQLVEKHTEYPTYGFIGAKIVNVLNLNLDLDKEF